MPSELGSVLRRQFSRFDEIVAFLDKAKPSAPYYSTPEVQAALRMPISTLSNEVKRLMQHGYATHVGGRVVLSAPKFIQKLENSRAKKPA